MKKFLFLVPLLFVLTACAADAEIVDITKTTTVTTQSAWQYIASNILSILAVPITVITAALANCVLVAIAKKFNISINSEQHDMVSKLAGTAVTKAEAWADAHKDSPSSNDKLNYAVQALRTVAGSDIAKKYTNEQLAHYVEEAVYKTFNQPIPIVTPVVAQTIDGQTKIVTPQTGG